MKIELSLKRQRIVFILLSITLSRVIHADQMDIINCDAEGACHPHYITDNDVLRKQLQSSAYRAGITLKNVLLSGIISESWNRLSGHVVTPRLAIRQCGGCMSSHTIDPDPAEPTATEVRLNLINNGATVQQMLSNPEYYDRYFDPRNSASLYHSRPITTSPVLNADNLQLDVQQGDTCQGHSVFTCLLAIASPNFSIVVNDPTIDTDSARHHFANTVFKMFGAETHIVNRGLIDLGFPITVINRVREFNTHSDHLLSLLADGPVVVGVGPRYTINGRAGHPWLGMDGNPMNHAIAVLGHIRSRESFIVADSVLNPPTLTLLHEKIFNLVADYPWKSFGRR